MNTIVMTGGTSGLGQLAASHMLAAPGARLLLGARRPGPPAAETLPLDLAHLDSARSFAAVVGERLGATPIDALVLNAGRSGHADGRSVDGFETTFVVNHLAHYLLVRLLLPRLANHARIVLTTSGTHDPAQRAPLPPPRHADARLLAHPELDPDRDQRPRVAAGRAYTASKLCVVLTARALAAQPEAQARQLTVVAYDPGRTPGTGLLRNEGLVLRGLWRVLGSPLLRPLVPRANSREAAGGALAELALWQGAPAGGAHLRSAAPGRAHLARSLGAGVPRRSDAHPVARQRRPRRPRPRGDRSSQDRHPPPRGPTAARPNAAAMSLARRRGW
jgi:NAD(P)-dependent dehydrogenase (short-subunit alcohol dehydrogenase family)